MKSRDLKNRDLKNLDLEINIYNFIQDLKNKLIPVCSTEREAEQQAVWMLEELTQKTYSEILQKQEIKITKSQQIKLDNWIEQRVKEQKPIQYIFGHILFGDLDLILEPPILIPRPETEEWCFWLIEKLKKVEKDQINILDLGTGTGCIALSLAKSLPNSTVVGVDINEKAIALAKKNKKINKIENAYFIKSDFYNDIKQELSTLELSTLELSTLELSTLELPTRELKNKKIDINKFDLIVSNPPYITLNDWKSLDNVVRKWEDKRALVSNSGLAAYKEIVFGAKKWLNLSKNAIKHEKLNIPKIVLELGKGQENAVKQLLEEQNFTKIEFFKDLNKINRWIIGF